ncbi:uncharacterized protein, partial [Penaeus vannamei]|uniref:uncharacterized protein n=1 Tax=Penaeus vannamei TaxID=6689 RepID=UPI00387F5BA7
VIATKSENDLNATEQRLLSPGRRRKKPQHPVQGKTPDAKRDRAASPSPLDAGGRSRNTPLKTKLPTQNATEQRLLSPRRRRKKPQHPVEDKTPDAKRDRAASPSPLDAGGRSRNTPLKTKLPTQNATEQRLLSPRRRRKKPQHPVEDKTPDAKRDRAASPFSSTQAEEAATPC